MDIKKQKNEVYNLLKDKFDLGGVGITWKNGNQCILINAYSKKEEIQEFMKNNLPDVEFVIQIMLTTPTLQ